MKKMNLNSLILLVLFSIGFYAHAQDGVIRIPLITFTKPPGDLLNEKKKQLSYGDLEKRYKKYRTLSDLYPAENKYWQDKKFEAVDQDLYKEMPSQNETVLFDEYLGAVRDLGIFSIYIRPENNQNVRYGLTFGLQVHASLLKAALLRKVGYYQESPKFLKAIRLKFPNLEKMNEFVDKAFCEKGPSATALDCLSLDPYKRGFITQKNDQDFSLILHGSYLERLNAEVPSLFDGLTPANADNLQYLAQSRAFRGLAVPFVMGDVGESINRFSPQAVSMRSGWAQMNFMNSVYFDLLTSVDDVRWALDRYAKLTQKDWDEIVDAGQFPECTVRLTKSLLLHRYKNMMQSFYVTANYNNKAERDQWNQQMQQLAQRLAGLTIEPLTSINTSCVKEGRVTTENIPEYPQRFSNGPRKSPFESADLIKYLKISTQSAVLQEALNKLNEKIATTPNLSYKPVGVLVGPDGYRVLADSTDAFLGVNFNANRMITTGTFYGSTAPIQMVDTVSVSAGIGAQNIFDGLNGIRRNYGASASYIRTFTHVVPLDPTEPMKQAAATPWKDLLVESRLKSLAAPLKDGDLTAFLVNLKPGEVFTITDSLGKGAQIGWTSGLDALFGFVSGLSASSSFDPSRLVVLRQIQFSRSKEGLQVYIRDVDSHMVDANGNEKPDHDQKTDVYGVTFDVNYYINVFRIRAQRSMADLHTDAFLIKYNSQLMTDVQEGVITPTDAMKKQVDGLLEMGGKAASALRALIFQSSVDPLYANFRAQQFEISHKLKIDEVQMKLLWNRATKLDQHHEIKIVKTQLPNQVDGGEVHNQEIELTIDRKGELRGRDFFGLSLEVLNAYLAQKFQGKAPQYQAGGANPSLMPFGFAQWRTIRTDSETTAGEREGKLPTVSVIEHIWGGWSMKRKQMDVILNELKEQMKEIKVANFPLIPDGALQNVDKVDFFKVNSHLSLLPPAIEQIKELILAPEAKDQSVPKAKFVARLFQKLSELGGKARPQDMAVYNNLMKLIGNGDENQGRLSYKLQCEMNKRNPESGATDNTYAWSKGTGYECLAPWVEKIIGLSRTFPENDVRKQNRWMTEVMYVIDEQIPMAYLLNYLGKDKFLYYVELIGFRAGDEDGDNGYYLSNVYGEPAKAAPYANGLLSIIANKSNISPVEFEKIGSF